MSKYRMISRRLRYRMSPGWPAEIFASVTEPAPAFVGGGETVGASGVASPSVSCEPLGRGDGRRWNSTNATACDSPSSVTTKSFAVRPSIGFPSLSFTVTVCTLSRVFVRKVGAWGA
jgi:hypothetical protein